MCICAVVLELGSSISLLCSDSALYSSPYYTDGTITARPIAAASLGPKGPHMWNETSVAITFVCLSHLSFPVFLISTLLHLIHLPHPHNRHPPPSSHLPLGKLRGSLSWPKWERLICSSYLFVINSPPSHLLCSALSLPSTLETWQKRKRKSIWMLLGIFPPPFQTLSIIIWRLKWMFKMDIFPPWSHSFCLPLPLLLIPLSSPSLTSRHCPQMNVFPLGSSK